MNTIAKPFGLLMMFLYEFLGNYGLAVILFALVVKVILLPFQMKSKRSTMQTMRLQPEVKELEKRHGANKAKFNEEVAKLYKEEHINPMSGCLWNLLPFPILIALLYAIRLPLTIMMGVPAALLAEGGAILEKLVNLGFTSTVNEGYIQMAQAQFISENFDKFAGLSDKLRQIDYNFLGMNMSSLPQWNFLWTTDWTNPSVCLPGLGVFLIPVVSALISVWQMKISMKTNPVPEGQQNSNASMMLTMPLVSLVFGFTMPAAISLYWTISTILSLGQDVWLTKKYKKQMDAEDEVRFERERVRKAEVEAKRIEAERRKEEGLDATENQSTSKRKKQNITRQEQIEKAAEWKKKNGEEPEKEEPGRVDARRHALGRAYMEDRYADGGLQYTEEEIDEEEEALPKETPDTAIAEDTDVMAVVARDEDFALDDIEELEIEDDEETLEEE